MITLNDQAIERITHWKVQAYTQGQVRVCIFERKYCRHAITAINRFKLRYDAPHYDLTLTGLTKTTETQPIDLETITI